jgi:hypothetical protein
LKYVRTWWEVPSLYGSAIDAWNGARDKHPGDRKPPDGAPLFFRGGNYGHIVIADPDHEGMRSTDCHSSGDVSDDDIGWTERTWGYDYLGWTGDLNGVTLPLGDEDDMTSDDWDKLRRIVAEEVEKNNKHATDKVWDEPQTVTTPDGKDAEKSMRQIARETWQRVAKGL